MTKYETLLILHIVSVLVLVAGFGISTATGIASTRTKSTKLLAALSGLSARAEYFITIPGALGTIAFGTWLAEDGNWEYHGWLIAAYVLFGVALAVGSGILGPHARRVQGKAQALMEQGVTESEELQAEAASPIIQLLGMVEIAILIAFVYLMVAKPGV